MAEHRPPKTKQIPRVSRDRGQSYSDALVPKHNRDWLSVCKHLVQDQ